MCEPQPKCFGSFIIYIIIEYALIFIYFHQYGTLFFMITIVVFPTTMILSCILCSPTKIRLTFFCVTIQICQLFVLLLEIKRCYYELLFVTPLIFYFLLLLVYYGLIQMESHEESGEMIQWPNPRTFQRQIFPNPSIELDLSNMTNATSSVSSQPPTYDEVMKKDSKVMIHIESDPEPPSYSEAL